MKIAKTKLGRKDGGYTRLLGNIELGALISRLHSACISSGNELEKLILAKSDLFLMRTVEEMESLLLNGDKFSKKTYLIPKKLVKKSAKFKSEHEPDFLILKRETKTLYITELKMVTPLIPRNQPEKWNPCENLKTKFLAKFLLKL